MRQKNLKSGTGKCPVNGSPRWSYIGDCHSPDFVISYGSPAHEPSQEWVYTGDASTGGVMYIRREDDRENAPHRRTQKAHIVAKEPADTATPIEIADINLRNQVYRTFLQLAALTETHKKQLRRRGFSLSPLLSLLNCGSMPKPRNRPRIAMLLMEETGLNAQELLRVPGFFRNAKGHLSISGATGLMLPVYDVKGRIQGIQIRADKSKYKATGSRYTWLSSKRHGGPGCGAPACFLGNRQTSTIYVTEGSFKGASQIINGWSEAVICMSGVGNTNSVIEQIQQLERIDLIEQVVIMFDSDWKENQQVLKSLARLVKATQKLGLTVVPIGWNPKWGKGIDDAISNGMTKDHLFELPINGILRAAEKAEWSNQKLTSTSSSPTWSPEHEQYTDHNELLAETRESICDAHQKPTNTFISIAANTGTGKTYTNTRYSPPMTIQIYRNYSALEEAEQELRDTHGIGRVRVLYGRMAPPKDPNNHLEKKRFERAGCFRFTEMKARAERGHSPCEGCSFRPQPASENAEEQELCPYWKQRMKTMEEKPDYLLAVPQSFASNPDLLKLLPAEKTIDMFGSYANLTIDDCPDFIHHLTRERSISFFDFAQWLQHPGLNEQSSKTDTLKKWLQQLSIPFRSTVKEPLLSKEFRNLSKVLSRWKQEDIICEEPLDNETLPLRAIKGISTWLAKGGGIRFEGKNEKRRLVYLQPNYDLLNRIQNTTVLHLDATPNEPLLQWFANLMGMKFEAPEMKKRFPRIIQLPELLWDREQIKNNKPLVDALIKKIHENNGIVLGFKNNEEDEHVFDIDGWWGHSERGLNCYKGAKMAALLGHYALPIQEIENQVWQLRELSKSLGQAPPDAFVPFSFSTTRQYTDPWRPTSREMHKSDDLVVEQIRRHQHTSGVVQGSNRPRNFDGTVFLLSGEPLDGLPWEVPVELWSRKKLNEELGLGLDESELFGKPKEANDSIQALNEKRKEERTERIEDLIPTARQIMEELKRLPSIRELRELLGESGQVVSQSLAYQIRAHLEPLCPSKNGLETELEQEDKGREDVFELGVPDTLLKELNIKGLSGTEDSKRTFSSECFDSKEENGLFFGTNHDFDFELGAPDKPLSSSKPTESVLFVSPELEAVEGDRKEEESPQAAPPGWVPLSALEERMIPALAKVRLGTLCEFGADNGWTREVIRQVSETYRIAIELLCRFMGLVPSTV